MSMKRKADEIDLTGDSDDEDLRLKSSGFSLSSAPRLVYLVASMLVTRLYMAFSAAVHACSKAAGGGRAPAPATLVASAKRPQTHIPSDAGSSSPHHLSNHLLRELHEARMARRPPPLPEPGRPFSLLTYNVWFEDLELPARMHAIGEIMQTHWPDIICLQEVTPRIYSLLSAQSWWGRYKASACEHNYFTTLLYKCGCGQVVSGEQEMPFSNSVMGRGLRQVGLKIGPHTLRVATSHLESPISRRSMFHEERQQQCAQALEELDKHSNAVLAGDLNWDDKAQGLPPLPSSSWEDVWLELQAGDDGFTYDGRANPMLTSNLRKRVDRVLCKLADWRPSSITMLGTKAITPPLHYSKGNKQLPIAPSDHFGLLTQFQSKA